MREFNDPTKFWAAALEVVQTAQSDSIKAGSPYFNLGMSGGSAANLIDKLPASFDWEQTQLFQVDERCVPYDHKDSNARLFQEKLGTENAKKVRTRFFSFQSDQRIHPELEAKSLYADCGGVLDLAVLGIGPDGHTASLFPHSPALDLEDLVVSSQTEVFVVKERVGLSFKALAQSRHILVLMIGASKSEVFHTLQEPGLDYHEFPAAKILGMPQANFLWLNA